MGGPDPAVAAVRCAVRVELADLAPGSLVLVACSGGADSLALAAGTAFVASRRRLRAGAVVVDHAIQPGSADVAAAASAACRGLGLDPVTVVAVEVGLTGSGPEAAARDARYRALQDSADRLGASAVLLGHTRDDQAETVLLGLARGSGPRSLAGMAPRRGVLRRPFLELDRSSTERACTALGLNPWRDPTNHDPQLLRARIRTRTMPALEADLGPGVVAALSRTAALLREDADALDSMAADLLDRAELNNGALGRVALDQVALDPVVLAAAPAALRRRVLLMAARRAGSPGGSLRRSHALALDALVVTWSGQGAVPLPGSVEGVRACGRLVFRPTQPREE